MLKKSLLAVVIAGAMVTGAQAADMNGYLFGNVGKTSVDVDGIPGGSTDERDTGYKIGAGVQLNPYFGLEFQYADLGSAGTSGLVEVPDFGVFNVKTDASTKGLGANLVGTIPFERVKVFGKVGYHRLKTDFSIRVSDGFESGSASDSETKWTTSFGAGVSFAVTPQFDVLAEVERFRKVAGEFDIDLASVGLRYNF